MPPCSTLPPKAAAVLADLLGPQFDRFTGDPYSHVTLGMQDEAAARVAAAVDGES